MSLSHLIFELELTSPEELLVQARSLMQRKAVRDFWGRTCDFRSRESGDEAARELVSIFDCEHAAALKPA
ncbi:DUF6082 family protein [Streptomyces cinereoruber]